nr:alpha/beta hydrolase-fold protein [Deinobacterium chartae]
MLGPPFLETVELTFTLRSLPENTPPGSAFYLRTNLEGYLPDLEENRFQREEGRWILRRRVPLGALLAYKVTRGSVDHEEGDAWGCRCPARQHVVLHDKMMDLEVLSWQDLLSGERPSTRSGRIEPLLIHSPELDADLEVLVYLPPGHAHGSGRYPVLYLHDGDNVFDARTAFAGQEWGCDEAAEALAQEGLEGILVAVPVRGEQRSRDYTPFPARVNRLSPNAHNYLRFLTDTLKPEIDRRYRTRPHVASTGLAGSSFGGLVSLYGGLTRRDVFGFIGALSPSMWVGDHALEEFVRQAWAPMSRVYVDMGTLEGEDLDSSRYLVGLARQLAEGLVPRVREVRLAIGEGHWHDEPAWAARFPAMLRWFLEG